MLNWMLGMWTRVAQMRGRLRRRILGRVGWIKISARTRTRTRTRIRIRIRNKMEMKIRSIRMMS
jgi:hypothetical protein